MDDAEPSFAAPPSGTQGRRDTTGNAPSRAPSRAYESAPAPSAAAQSSYGDPRDVDGSPGFADEAPAPAPAAAAAAPTYTGDQGAALTLDEPWAALAARLPVRGIAAQLARQSELLRIDGNQLVLRVSARTLAEGQGAERLRTVLETHFGRPVRVSVEVGTTGSDTAHAVEQSVRSARQQAAEEAILADPFVRTLMDNFGGQIVPNSISPVSPELPVKETPK